LSKAAATGRSFVMVTDALTVTVFAAFVAVTIAA
jgi:hypothetical protein